MGAKLEIKNIACLIPARRGSKRLQGKNLKLLKGRPILDYTFEAAKRSLLTNIFFSTNYLKHEVPFFDDNGMTWVSRPKEAATDTSSAYMYIQHFLDRYPLFHAVVLLQPTSPLRTFVDVNNALKMFLDSHKPTLVSAYKIDGKSKLYTPSHKSIQKNVEYNGFENQFLYYRNSAIYIFTRGHFLRYKSIFSQNPIIYEMPLSRSIDINTIEDFWLAERILK